MLAPLAPLSASTSGDAEALEGLRPPRLLHVFRKARAARRACPTFHPPIGPGGGFSEAALGSCDLIVARSTPPGQAASSRHECAWLMANFSGRPKGRLSLAPVRAASWAHGEELREWMKSPESGPGPRPLSSLRVVTGTPRSF